MIEPSNSKIIITFPFIVRGIYCKLQGVYLDVPISACIYLKKGISIYVYIGMSFEPSGLGQQFKVIPGTSGK